MNTRACPPGRADWYANVVIAKPGQDTTYNDGYFKGPKPTRAFIREALVPSGWTVLEWSIRATPQQGGNDGK